MVASVYSACTVMITVVMPHGDLTQAALQGTDWPSQRAWGRSQETRAMESCAVGDGEAEAQPGLQGHTSTALCLPRIQDLSLSGFYLLHDQ